MQIYKQTGKKTKDMLASKAMWPFSHWLNQQENSIWKNGHLWFSEAIFKKKTKSIQIPELSATWLLFRIAGFLLTHVASACPLSHMCFPCKLSVTCQNWSGSLRTLLSDGQIWTRQHPISGSLSHTVWKLMSPSLYSQNKYLYTMMMRFLKVKKNQRDKLNI